MNIENAKKLLRKAIDLNDNELMQMAEDLIDKLDSNETHEETFNHKQEPKPVADTIDPATKHGKPNITDDVFSDEKTKASDNGDFIFKMRSKNEENSNRGGVPVNEIKDRVNSFVDDGIEAKDITTPKIEPTERKRPRFKMIEQICQKCGEKQKTHPTHKREYYICDRCISK